MTSKQSKKTANSSNVPALDKAFLILDYLTAINQPVSASQIARDLNMARSSTHNLLSAMTNKGVLHKDAYNLFTLGSYLLYWSGKFQSQQDIISLFHETMTQFPFLMEQTVTLSSLDEQTGEVVFLACHESPAPLGFTFRPGIRVPATFSASGKAMLSTFDIETIKTIYAHTMPTALTPYSVKNFEQLEEELVKVRTNKTSLDDGQLREGMYCVGTHILDNTGKPIAGVAVSFVKTEYEKKQIETKKALVALAILMEQRIGFKKSEPSR
ncbi:MAG: IclR family transcriptional regulator [Gammaproteobacteria bacterium]|nr:MAG: IclR family transcriptional regulator [Gammaproteobacteria bacterium]